MLNDQLRMAKPSFFIHAVLSSSFSWYITKNHCWFNAGFRQRFSYIWIFYCLGTRYTSLYICKRFSCCGSPTWRIPEVLIILTPFYFDILLLVWLFISIFFLLHRLLIGGSVLYYPQLSSISSYQLYVEVSMLGQHCFVILLHVFTHKILRYGGSIYR